MSSQLMQFTLPECTGAAVWEACSTFVLKANKPPSLRPQCMTAGAIRGKTANEMHWTIPSVIVFQDVLSTWERFSKELPSNYNWIRNELRNTIRIKRILFETAVTKHYES